ncbi:NAD(P)/FAD-dependent oxidoreductase [Yinghuangia seranimata]|uniref:NAD(P)/FAD-dependent oxidoreductase n=1 Tax=Yinghuangia seranimata TaxID=408067 RepID=UPI00248ACE0A|nr:FAD-binding oxidoreductase [Yinghuangia seranimata]MDI2127508.1 FAD-binding oxidoreductase [Yinghuangia seranimata]
MSAAYRDLSLWFDTLGEDVTPRPALAGDLDVDVAIVGAGYTRLWTAYYLAEADPSLRIAVLEREVAGFGASGRNGGWCSSLFPASLAKVARGSTRERAVAQQRAMNATVDEVGRVVAAEGIDCGFTKGGTVMLARTHVQTRRAWAMVEDERSWGFGKEDVRYLDADEARARVGATDVLGGVYTPHCAAIQPAKLARGLAEAVERRGVTIYEGTPVTLIDDGAAVTPHGTVRAEVVVRATEGYTPELPGFTRDIVPVYSLMIATEPLPQEVWDEIGLAERETFSDLRHLIIYGQRTEDGRLAFGGRGAPYHFGSRVRPEYDRDERVFAELKSVLRQLFPQTADAEITHTWGGALGVSRDWYASCGIDRGRRLAWAGGYVGDGVGTTNLAGRTLADLVRDQYTELTRLPWVQHRSPRWEPEPLRWIGTNVGLRVMTAADGEEQRTGKDSRLAKAFGRFLGH